MSRRFPHPTSSASGVGTGKSPATVEALKTGSVGFLVATCGAGIGFGGGLSRCCASDRAGTPEHAAIAGSISAAISSNRRVYSIAFV